MMVEHITKAQALETLSYLKTHAFPCYQGEGLWGFVQSYIENSTEPPKPPKWVPSDTPWSERAIDGFTLKDEVKVYSSPTRWFVVGLRFETGEIICNAVDYYKPFAQNSFPSSVLTFVTHGKDE